MTNSSNQISRLLELVPYLRRNPETTVAAAAKFMGVTETQLVKDLNIVWMCGLPHIPGELMDLDMDAAQQGGAIRLHNAEHLPQPLKLGSDEAVALLAALTALPVDEISQQELVAGIIGKLKSAISDQVSVVIASTSDNSSSRITEIDQAINSRQKLRINYYVPTRDESSWRVVHPIQIFHTDKQSYLSAFCAAANAIRTFNLARIHDIQLVSEYFEPIAPAAGSSAAFVASQAATLVTLELASELSWIADYYPVTQVKTTAAGVTVELYVNQISWLVRLVRKFAPQVRIIGPTEVASQVLAAIKADAGAFLGETR